MASVAYFLRDIENIIDEIESRLVVGEDNVVKYYVFARTIQAVFRGYITRKHIKLLHKSATCIQKNWRGFVDRFEYRVRLKEKFDEMCWLHYCYNATIIQKSWRGFWVRLKVFSYYRLKAWLAFVMQQNKILKCSVLECQSKANEVDIKLREDEAKEWVLYILFKLHHLLRTHQLSGIYSLPNTTELSDIEKMLKCLKYKDFMIFYNSYMDDMRKAKAKELPRGILQQCKHGAHFEREYYEHKKPHKDFLFSKLSYHSRSSIFPCIEIREQKRMKEKPLEPAPSRPCQCRCQIKKGEED